MIWSLSSVFRRQSTLLPLSLLRRQPVSYPSPSASSSSASRPPPSATSDGTGGPRPSPLDPSRTAALRAWRTNLERRTTTAAAPFDRTMAGCEVRFDRSGGKGGQNVNKLNTKATLTVKLDQAPWISPELLPALKSSPFYAPTSHTLVLSGSVHRTQALNLADCFSKLRAHLIDLAGPLLPAETSASTRARVEGHQERFSKRVREEKTRRKEIKAGRRSTQGKKGWD